KENHIMDMDYRLERQLSVLDPRLHRRYKDCVVTCQAMLSRYQSTFPTYTDHTLLHAMDVSDFCNRLIGDQLDGLTGEDLYVLLMACLFHDVGMGISLEDYELFKPQLGLTHLSGPSSQQERAEITRDFHQEFSAMFLAKYGDVLDIPNEAYRFAIIQVCRGHRKTDLMDHEAYSATFPVEEGRTVCLPYLSALLCLADELDVAVDRNISFLYDMDKIDNPISRMEFAKHEAIRWVELEEHIVTLHAHSDDPAVRDELMRLSEKLGDKLSYCRLVAATCTQFVITQKNVRLVLNAAKEVL
ncbi:MAG: hypothetical protein RR949_08160, partial [Oscillospiraceae bacterium]